MWKHQTPDHMYLVREVDEFSLGQHEIEEHLGSKVLRSSLPDIIQPGLVPHTLLLLLCWCSRPRTQPVEDLLPPGGTRPEQLPV